MCAIEIKPLIYLIIFSLFRLGRCECLEDIWIDGGMDGFDPKKIVCNPEAKEESEKLAKRAQSLREQSFFYQQDFFIAFLNVRSLKKHWQDIQCDAELLQCQLLGLAETWLSDGETIDLQHFPVTEFANGGNGKGTVAYAKDSFINVMSISEPTFSFVSVTISVNGVPTKVIFVYLSTKANYLDFLLKLRPQLSRDLPTILMGDFNFHFSDQKHVVKDYLEENGFRQMIHEATHDEGNILDQIYARPPELLTRKVIYQKPLYFSDHDALCVKFQ